MNTPTPSNSVVTDLLPCPFPHEVRRGVFLEVDTDDFGFVRGACSDCGCAGPYITLNSLEGATAAEQSRAARLWNTRMQSASTTGSDELVEHLRRVAQLRLENPDLAIEWKAADEIERLRAIATPDTDLQREHEALKDDFDRRADLANDFLNENIALTDRVAVLEKAIRELLDSCDRGPPLLHDGCGTTIISAPSPEAMKKAIAALSQPLITDIERDEPDDFEAWWQKHPHKNRELANYTVKKQIAWDAWYARSKLQALSPDEGMRRALEPFATCWTEEELDGATDDMPIEHALYAGSQPTVGDLRKARKALSSREGG